MKNIGLFFKEGTLFSNDFGLSDVMVLDSLNKNIGMQDDTDIEMIPDVNDSDFYTEEERNRVAEENQNLVYYVVNKFNCVNGLQYDDLVSAGMVGYAKAINTYNKNKNVRFSTYAYNCIRNEILFYLRKETRHLKNNISMDTVLATDKNGNEFKIEDTASFQTNIVTMEEQVIEDDMDNIKKQWIYEALSELTKQEQYIMMHRFGINIDESEIKTQVEIARALDMSQANVSRIQQKCTEKIQKKILEKQKEINLKLLQVI